MEQDIIKKLQDWINIGIDLGLYGEAASVASVLRPLKSIQFEFEAQQKESK